MARTRRRGGGKPCVYCGVAPAETMDHVFPQVLWGGRPLDPDMVTVPVCKQCQRRKEAGDVYLRDFVNYEIAGRTHPYAAAQRAKTDRATDRNRSKFGRALRDDSAIEAVVSDAGDLRWVRTVPVDAPLMLRTLEYVVRGLYYHETKTMLPTSAPVTVAYVQPARVPAVLAHYDTLPQTNAEVKGDAIAGWLSRRPDDAPLSTEWLLEFNGAVYFVGVTGAAAEDWNRYLKGTMNDDEGRS